MEPFHASCLRVLDMPKIVHAHRQQHLFICVSPLEISIAGLTLQLNLKSPVEMSYS
jgi:hypothetical protein